MADRISKKQRSENMRRIRSKDTKPEKTVRSTLHKMGYRFRLHGVISKKIYPSGIIPGKPDLVLVKYKTVIFVNGCFWHHHEGCKYSYVPKSRTEWWVEKFDRNIKRDIEVEKEIGEMGWNIIKIWECEIKDLKSKDLEILLNKKLEIANSLTLT